jgi:flavin-dependent dehydrogenase
MIVDAREVPDCAVLETEVCIMGGGPAAISLAREFDAHAFRVILLEGGRLSRDRAGQALYKGESVGLHYED